MSKSIFDHCKEGNEQGVRECLAASRVAAIIRTSDGENITPLHFAAGDGHVAIVQLLLQAGADMDAKDTIGRTPLHLSCQKGQSATAQLLLQSGADKDTKNKYRVTPLHEACAIGHRTLVQLLLQEGADTEIEDMDGNTALDMARQMDHMEIANLLEEWPRRRGKESLPDSTIKFMSHTVVVLAIVDVIESIVVAAANHTNKNGYKGLGFAATLYSLIICGLCYLIFTMVYKRQLVTQLMMGFLIGYTAMLTQMSFFLSCVFFTFATESRLNKYGLDLVDNAFGAFLFFNFFYFAIFTRILWSKRSDLVKDEMANLYTVIHL